MTDRYANIRKALAMGPTPGEWYWSDAYRTRDGRKTWSLLGNGGFGILSCDGDENSPQSVNAADADLIAACDPDTIRALLAERDALREALALLPDESDMIEHNPDEGPRTFCCWQEIKLRGLHDYLITHDEGCWYARMRALRDQENSNDQHTEQACE